MSRELVSTLGVQRREDARNLTSLRARRRFSGDLEQPPGDRRRKTPVVPFCGIASGERSQTVQGAASALDTAPLPAPRAPDSCSSRRKNYLNWKTIPSQTRPFF